MKKYLLIVLIALLVSNCGTSNKSLVSSQTDSTRVEIQEKEKIIYRDTIIYIKIPAEASSVATAQDDSSHLETGIATSDAYIKDGKLIHTLRNKSEAILPASAKIPEKYYQKLEYKYKDRLVRVPVEVEKELSKWQKLQMNIGKLAMILIAIWIAIKLIRAKL